MFIVDPLSQKSKINHKHNKHNISYQYKLHGIYHVYCLAVFAMLLNYGVLSTMQIKQIRF